MYVILWLPLLVATKMNPDLFTWCQSFTFQTAIIPLNAGAGFTVT